MAEVYLSWAANNTNDVGAPSDLVSQNRSVWKKSKLVHDGICFTLFKKKKKAAIDMNKIR